MIYPIQTENRTWAFRVWAPGAGQVTLLISSEGQEIPMEGKPFGYWETEVSGLPQGARYRYRIGSKDSFPDPASLSQPDGVHGDSELIRLDDFNWTDKAWEPVPLDQMIQYEIHTGTFSPEGNFRGIIDRLNTLAELGINAIELMPVGQFSGRRNWGYDGAYPFAVHHSYGGASGLMELVNACHLKGISVILDVVYNHFGPEGNYLAGFGPYFSEDYSTPWGKPLNFDGANSDPVRNFIFRNALMWIRDFHIDVLRLDAVHAILDRGATHVLQGLAEFLQDACRSTNRKPVLIAESNLNDVRYIAPAEKGGYGLDAQWSDDFHHSVHALITGERDGYYMDFGQPGQLRKAMHAAFVFDGQYSVFRKKSYGKPAGDRDGEQFVIFSQNHDQVGNRRSGERLISLTGFETAKLIAGTLFVSPNTPLLFMGEEYGETNPFLYFVSHEDQDLNEKVREGRKKEFEAFFGTDGEIPDPASEETFKRSKLSWKFSENTQQKAMWNYYQYLIRLKKSHPVLKTRDRNQMKVHQKGRLLTVERWNGEARMVAYLNYKEEEAAITVPPGLEPAMEKILDSSDAAWMGPGPVRSGPEHQASVHPESITAGDRFDMRGRTIIIYSNYKA